MHVSSRVRISLGAIALAVAMQSPSTAAAPAESIRLRDFETEYKQVLDLFSNGDEKAAIDRLVDVEMELLYGKEEVSIKALWKAKLQVVRDLLGAGHDILIPVALFHEQAYLAYLEKKQSALATHSRIMAMELVEVYAADSSQQPDLVLASNVFTSLAGHLQKYYRDTDATALYYQAIRLDPENVTALLGVAAIHERHGDYRLAIQQLERLIAIDPNCHEGRLRLGVNLARAARLDESAAVLDPLLSAAAPDWVASVAFEEAAKVEVDRGDLQRAFDLLSDGVARFPNDTTLPIQLAYVADRAGMPTSQPDLAAALREGSTPAGSRSPRYVYSQAPYGDLETLRLELRHQTVDLLATLADALGFATAVGAGS